MAALFVWSGVFARSDSGTKISFFNIGQGDAILIQQGDLDILIDGGPDSGILNKLGQSLNFFNREIELVVLSHSDSDHISGLVDVFKKYKIEAVLATFAEGSNANYKAILGLISEKGIQKIKAQAGIRIYLGEESYFDVLYPFDDLEGQSIKNTNSTSVLIRLVVKDKTFLFTGDLEAAQEYQVLAENIFLDSQVLKVGHHGSKTSTTEQFLSAVRPSYAVISAGLNNRYGHPHEEVMERLKESDAEILRTDLMGDVVISVE